jgi:hypothetical protein
MQMMNKFIAVTCSILLVSAPMTVYADPPTPDTPDLSDLSLGRVSQLRAGQCAPFAGVLFSNEAAARLFGDIKFTERECQLRLTREIRINTLQLTAQIDALKLRLDVENTRTTQLISIKDQRIKFLEEQYSTPAWYESGEFWFAVGLVGGVLISIGAGYAIGQAGK